MLIKKTNIIAALFTALTVIILSSTSIASPPHIFGVRISDLNKQPLPPNPIRIWGKVTSVSPLRITDGKGVVEVTGKTASLGEYLVLDGFWNGSVFSLSQPPVVTYTGQMIYVPGGNFLMGNSNTGDDAYYHYADELPQHSVYLSEYYIGKYEVTRGEYRKFIDAGGYSRQSCWSTDGWNWKVSNNRTQPAYWDAVQNWGTPPGSFTQTDNHPVVGVSYYEAEAFCKWAGGRLPSEAEWERAARWDSATSHPNIYPWGDVWINLCNNLDDYLFPGYQTSPVGSYSDFVSPVGCEDMAGNVWEWCSDWYDSSYYSQAPSSGWTNPRGPASGTTRVLRGGGFNTPGGNCRCAYRHFDEPYIQNFDFGFRVVKPVIWYNTRPAF